ncbi:MAG: hypothetical protein AB7F89_17650, partial [Pirellulaceae bacterium]
MPLIWPHCDSAEPLFSQHAFSPWSSKAFGDLVAAGLLLPANNADWVRCPACGDHVEEVLLMDGPHGVAELYIYCP